MAKVTINGEVFGFDLTRKPMAEALALEQALGMPYGQWEEDFGKGWARAAAGFVWLVWRRNGRDVSFEDILSGKIDVDLNGLDVQPDEGEMDPTGPPTGPSDTTGNATSAHSPKSSGSARGRSGSSPRTSSSS